MPIKRILMEKRVFKQNQYDKQGETLRFTLFQGNGFSQNRPHKRGALHF